MANISDLDINIDQVDRIHHISDIHIRNRKRHDEYRVVLERLYKSIKENSTENSLITVLGDVAHSKTDMSPELVQMMSEFFSSLTDIRPTIVITGNHDTNVKNMDRLDAITPVVDSMNDDDLHYIRENGLYRVGDVVFSHFSIFADTEDHVLASEIPNQYKKIALYHGTIHKAETDTGYVLREDDVKVENFVGFDIGLFGDIHKPQTVSEYKEEKLVLDDESELQNFGSSWCVKKENSKYHLKRKWPEAVYSGSLIQQNHGEGLKHGYCEWNLSDNSFDFVEIENDYGYYTLNIIEGIIPLKSDIPNKPRLRLQVKDTDSNDLRRIKTDLRYLYDVKELTSSSVNPDVGGSADRKLQVDNISSLSYQNELIVDYVKDYFAVEDTIVEKVREINEDVNSEISKDDLSKSVTWKPVKFEFSNMFSYGEENVIYFDKMRDVVGIFAENASGKSAIFGALAFCLFDKTPRAHVTSDILNTNKDWFECKLEFEIDETRYYIERYGEKKSSGRIPVEVDFYKIENGEKINLKGKRRGDTNRIIRQYVGDYDDFILTTLSVQNNNTVFIDKTQSGRKDVLARFIGIDIFEELYSIAKKKSKGKKTRLDDFESEDLPKKIAKVEKEYEKYEEKIENLKDEKEELQNKKEALTNEKLSYKKKLVDIPDEDLNINELEDKKGYLEEKIESLKDDIEFKNIKVREISQAIKGLKELTSKVDQDQLKQEYKEFNEKKKKLKKLERDIKYIQKSLSKNKENYDHLINHSEFDPDCEYCVKRNERDAQKIDELQESISEEENELQSLKSDKSDIQDFIDNTNVEKRWNKFNEIKEKIESHENQVSSYEKEISDLKNQKIDLENKLESVSEDIELYYKIEDGIEKNKKINSKIETVLEKINSVKKDLREVENKLNDAQINIGMAEERKDTLKKRFDSYKELSNEYEAYEYYLEAVHRDGVPYEIIEKALPRIEQEVNEILSQIVNFSVVFETDGKNINSYMINSQTESKETKIPLKNASGMEGFVSSLAIRVALTNISNLPRSNFLAIDEGFGVLDSEKRNSLIMVFDTFKTKFDFVFFVTHLESLRDIADDILEVQVQNGFSKVQYL